MNFDTFTSWLNNEIKNNENPDNRFQSGYIEALHTVRDRFAETSAPSLTLVEGIRD